MPRITYTIYMSQINTLYYVYNFSAAVFSKFHRAGFVVVGNFHVISSKILCSIDSVLDCSHYAAHASSILYYSIHLLCSFVLEMSLSFPLKKN